MRLDKYLCETGCGTRFEVKKKIKQGLVTVNGTPAKDGGMIIDELQDYICFNNQRLSYEKDLYFAFYKPAGCVTANEDALHKTVFDYFPDDIRKRINAVGRLDLDTEGLLFLTSDGDFLHHLISPSHRVPKTYYARLDHAVPNSAIESFMQGIDIGDEKPTIPAELEILSEEDCFSANLKICEGRFHQVKRMFHSIGCEVIYLKRIKEGAITLDGLLPGEYRKLTEDEIQQLKKKAN
ncbi:MAG: rRNA pseudouridine synthase [Lachnospiraceae bacterium]|nr:rRNA pseudouridine synthase [Lachnospiraceae bacterium]